MTSAFAAAPARRRDWIPVRDVRFWLVQVLVVVVYLLHQLDAGRLGIPEVTAIPHLAVESLFLLPVLYAAFIFGLRGSLATAAWVTALMILDINLDMPGMPTAQVWAHYLELGTLDVVAIVVGRGVETERDARARAEAAEVRYRELFENNPSPLLVVDLEGQVRAANSAAEKRFGCLAGEALDALVGREAAAAVLAGRDAGVLSVGNGMLRALPSVLADEQMVQVAFADVTEQARRENRLATYASCVLAAQEDERRRVAQDLHDELVQDLIQLRRELEGVGSAVNPSAVDGPAASLGAGRLLAERMGAELWRIIHGLRPPALDDLGLDACLRQAGSGLEERTGMTVRVEAGRPPHRLGSAQELALFRIAQEALSNVERHARASRVVVGLGFEGSWARLSVSDDGRGFNPAPLAELPADQLGLLGMLERAELVGGRLELRSAPGQGTTVRAWVPLGADEMAWTPPLDSPPASPLGTPA